MSANVDKEPVKKSHRSLVIKCVIVVVGMFGFCFALVPIYDTFCKLTGLQGKYDTGRTRVPEFATYDMSRTVRVNFVSQVTSNFGWDFHPMVSSVIVHPGEMKRVSFFVKNQSGRDTVGQAIPSIAPGIASLYFKKTECFCFKQQYLQKGQEAEMPLVFFLDKQLPKEIEELTLSYTLFDAETVRAGSKINSIATS